MSRLFLCFLAVLLGCGLFWTPPSHADVTCQAMIQNGNINFGNVDPSQGSNVDVPATIRYDCSNTDNKAQPLTLCFNIGYGSAGAAADGNRQMAGTGASKLEFQLYSDAARTQIAGSIPDNIPLPITQQFQVPKKHGGNPGIYSGTVNIYARLPGNQGSPTGAYSASFTPRLTGSIGYVSCQNTYDDGISAMSQFNVVATVPPACNTVTATDLDFGQNMGLLTASIDGTSVISITCVNGTPYQVGLDNGKNAAGTTRRMMLNGGDDYVTYGLYRDSTYTQPWGNTPNADTVVGTSNGSIQQISIYGRVPPQITPTQGNYADTVTVYVYY